VSVAQAYAVVQPDASVGPEGVGEGADEVEDVADVDAVVESVEVVEIEVVLIMEVEVEDVVVVVVVRVMEVEVVEELDVVENDEVLEWLADVVVATGYMSMDNWKVTACPVPT
jgi:hypothetical protein